MTNFSEYSDGRNSFAFTNTNLLSSGSFSEMQLNHQSSKIFTNQVMRPRSLYTIHSNPSLETKPFQAHSDHAKYLGNPLTEQWHGIDSSNDILIRKPLNNQKPVMASYSFGPDEISSYQNLWKELHLNNALENMSVGAVATLHGAISLRLHHHIQIEMSLDRAIRIINFKNNVLLSLSSSGSAAALLHPNGKIYQYGSRVEILAHDTYGNNKYAKMWYKGVSFTSEQCALVYLVDAAGTRTTTDSFSDMSQDFSLSVFFAESRHQHFHFHEAVSVLEAAQYWQSDEGVENWIINNVRISQTPDGLVKIARSNNKYQLRTSPTNGTASVTTPFLHCTASLGQTSHLFVRRGERRMHYDGTSFIVRNAGHSAGFDNNNQLKVY